MSEVYDLEYSTTDGEMWVEAGEENTEVAAKKRLRVWRRAGHLARVIARDSEAVGTVKELIARGQARICE